MGSECGSQSETGRKIMKATAIVLAGGSGRRMNSKVKKQFLSIGDKPLLYYSLKTFEDSFVDEVILVASQEDVEYCQKEIIDRFHFNKVRKVVPGGKERYHSVANGILAAKACDYVFIHDGARPFVTEEILQRLSEEVKSSGACVAAMPVKDTIKIADADGYISSTPKRDLVWMIQTPQVFSYDLIKDAYTTLLKEEKRLAEEGILITDDAMVVETLMGKKVRLVEGSYRNIKITTPEDIDIAECFLKA